MTTSFTVTAVEGLPEVRPGASLPDVIVAALREHGPRPEDGDILVVAQKVVSKAEGSVVDLRDVTPSPEAVRLAGPGCKDPRLVEVILRESKRVVRAQGGVLITEHRLGYISANAGVDQQLATLVLGLRP